LGDPILTDGLILRAGDNFSVADTVFSDVEREMRKSGGDFVQAGSYCVSGWAAYQVQSLPAEELRVTQLNAVPQTHADLTALQKTIDSILRILLVVTTIFVVILVQRILQVNIVSPEVQQLSRDAASIIFSIAPSGLFFMIIVSYNMGTFDLLKLGALVRDSRSVESLAQVTTICFGKSGTLTGIDVQMEMLPQPADDSTLGENRVRQIVGDFAHSSSSLSSFVSEIRKSFDGQKRAVSSESRFLSTYGWCALTFQDPDLQGTYVLARPGLFQVEFNEEEAGLKEEIVDGVQQDSVLQRTWGRLRGILNRGTPEDQKDEDSETGFSHTMDDDHASENESKSIQDPLESVSKTPKPNIFNRMRNRVTNIVRRATPPDEPLSELVEPERDPARLIFAHATEESLLFDQNHRPTLPENLIPISYLTFTEQIRPEARKAVEIFTDAGVQVNIFSEQNANDVLSAARELGLEDAQLTGLKTLSGTDIERLYGDQLIQTVRDTTIFAPVNSTQKAKVIETLDDGGDYVAMIGEGLGDVEALQQAHLSITIQGGSQVAVSFADIVLLKDSLEALPQVLQRGRKIVNGLIDVLKLNLVQVAYIFFLLIATVLLGNKVFFYDPAQGGLIVFFTIVIPSIGVTLWATSSAISESRIRSQLLRFIIPVGITSALAGLFIYYIFLNLSGDIRYAQLGVTYTLTMTGILMILFIMPPSKFWVGNSPLRGDKRVIWVVLVMFVLFGITMVIPLAQELLKVAPLRKFDHYMIIAGVTLVWVILTKLVFLIPWLRYRK
jgi:magnesium-transporting ATPase (P-type)